MYMGGLLARAVDYGSHWKIQTSSANNDATDAASVSSQSPEGLHPDGPEIGAGTGRTSPF